MKSFGVRELQQNASAVLRLVKAGESVEITEHGRRVAILRPATESSYQNKIRAGLMIIPEVTAALGSQCRTAKAGSDERTTLEILLEDRRD